MINLIVKNKLIKTAIEITKLIEDILPEGNIVHFSTLLPQKTTSYSFLTDLYNTEENKKQYLILQENVKDLLPKSRETFKNLYLDFTGMKKYNKLKNTKPELYEVFEKPFNGNINNIFNMNKKKQTDILLKMLDAIRFKKSKVATEDIKNSNWWYETIDFPSPTDKEYEFGSFLENKLYQIEVTCMFWHYIMNNNSTLGAFVFFLKKKRYKEFNGDLKIKSTLKIKQCESELIKFINVDNEIDKVLIRLLEINKTSFENCKNRGDLPFNIRNINKKILNCLYYNTANIKELSKEKKEILLYNHFQLWLSPTNLWNIEPLEQMETGYIHFNDSSLKIISKPLLTINEIIRTIKENPTLGLN